MFLGVDHSSNEIGFAMLDKNGVRTRFIDRKILSERQENTFDLLGIDKTEIQLVGLTYASADGINAITNIKKVKNRGQEDDTFVGFARPFGGGTKVYRDIESDGINAVLIPGVHDGLQCLDSYFRHYSNLCTSDKTALTYFASDYLTKKLLKNPSFITCSLSSSIMATVVEKNNLKGGAFWLGGAFGIIDFHVLRLLKDNKLAHEEAFTYNSLFKRQRLDYGSSFKSAEFLEMTSKSALQVIFSLVPFVERLDAVFISGRFCNVKFPLNVVEIIRKKVKKELGVPLFIGEENATAIGAALIAKKAFDGTKEIIGIPVDL